VAKHDNCRRSADSVVSEQAVTHTAAATAGTGPPGRGWQAGAESKAAWSRHVPPSPVPAMTPATKEPWPRPSSKVGSCVQLERSLRHMRRQKAERHI
jgi:hypothetical protein